MEDFRDADDVDVRSERCERVNIAEAAAQRVVKMRTSQRGYVLNSLYMYMLPNRLFISFLPGAPTKFTHSPMFTPQAWGRIFPLTPRSAWDPVRTCNHPAPSGT